MPARMYAYRQAVGLLDIRIALADQMTAVKQAEPVGGVGREENSEIPERR
jgi:hypothetical protein